MDMLGIVMEMLHNTEEKQFYRTNKLEFRNGKQKVGDTYEGFLNATFQQIIRKS